MSQLLRVEKINKSFDKHSVLRDVSFEVNEGEFVCFIGPSGCGKSTLLRILLGLEKADSGKVVYSKEDSKKALVFQSFALFPWLTVSENIGFGLKMSGESSAKTRGAVQKTIKDFELAGSEKLHPKELSGGMKQRVGLGRAMVMEPDILFLDEPFSAVDALTAKDLRKILIHEWIKLGMTVVMVTHLVEEAVELADRIYVLGNNRGKSSLEATIDNRLKRPRDLRSSEFFKLVDELESKIR